MLKLSNGIEYQNIHLSLDKAEYLIRNGFAVVVFSSDTLQFEKGDVHLFVRNNAVDMFLYYPEDIDRSKRFVFKQSHSGISEMDTFGWIMLMQIMGVQRATYSRMPMVSAGEPGKKLLAS